MEEQAQGVYSVLALLTGGGGAVDLVAGGDFVLTGAGGGAEAGGVGDDLAAGEGLGFFAAHAVPGEGGGGVVGAGGLGEVEDGAAGRACRAWDGSNYSRWKFRWGRTQCAGTLFESRSDTHFAPH